jgi:hypothetical protein
VLRAPVILKTYLDGCLVGGCEDKPNKSSPRESAFFGPRGDRSHAPSAEHRGTLGSAIEGIRPNIHGPPIHERRGRMEGAEVLEDALSDPQGNRRHP